MSEAVSCLIWLRDPSLAPLALAQLPAWAWTLDGAQILWANPQGAALLGASAPSALTSALSRLEASDMTAQVARLSLPADGSQRIERLQGFGTSVERTLSCHCARITLADGADAILIAAAEPTGPELSLAQKVAYWLADTDAPVAAFAADGTLIDATAAAQARLAGARTLAALGADGHAAGETAAGKLAIDRVGPVVFATFEDAMPASAERHQPLRFVWQIDAEGRFTLDSEEFAALTGAHAVLGRSWQALSTSLGLDPDDQIARALATRDTFSGLTIGWPVDDGSRLAVEMSGLPVFDRERRFRGYRGFGICRDLPRLNALAQDLAQDLAQRPAARVPASAAAMPLEPQPAARETDPGSEADYRDETAATADEAAPSPTARAIGPLLDRLPVGILIYRLNELIYANRLFLRWTGYASVAALARAGGIESLLIGSGAVEPGEAPFTITSSQGESVPVAGRLFSVPWEGDKAFALITTPATSTAIPAAPPAESSALADARAEIAELHTMMDMTGDAIMVLDGELRVTSSNRYANTLFGADTLVGTPFAGLLTPASADQALAQIARLGESAAPIDITGRTHHGTLLTLSMRLARLGPDRLCVVLRDLTPWQKSEAELVAARRQAEQQSSAKSEFLAKVSHEIRNPLNAIVGFAELMMEERFGAIRSDRYRQYLKDIHGSGGHIMSLVNDLIDLSKIESGRLELAFTGVALNELVEQCVALMQPQANREGVIVRTSLSARLPEVTADARSLRQIVLNLVASSIKLGGTGGQVIVSTARAESGAVILRVRDTGAGIGEDEVAAVLEPLRQTPTRSSGAGIGLPLAKALAEANGASLQIESRTGSGTLIEVTFPRERTLE